MIVLATELPGLQKGLLTTSLTGGEWLACLGLAALLPLTVETGKWIRRRRGPAPVIDAQRAVSPSRAITAPIIPRWEWRTFGRRVRRRPRRLRRADARPAFRRATSSTCSASRATP